MLIVSWNVAGLSTTLNRIHMDYRHRNNDDTNTYCNKTSSYSCSSFSSNNKNSDSNSNRSAFACYLERHKIDILAIQEHKIPLTQLSSKSEPYCVASRTQGYESFWSCNTSASTSRTVCKAKAGMNGVCTFVRQGLTLHASNTILDDSELDDQGRCVMTDHAFCDNNNGIFHRLVVFNVYVPCREDHENKMQFLNALRRAMSKQREQGKHVILVGDLNIAHKEIDVHWKWRPISIQKIYNESENWAVVVRKCWPTIFRALKSWEVSTCLLSVIALCLLCLCVV